MKGTIIFVCIMLILTACGASPEQQAANTATAQTATAAAWTPTPTIAPSPIPTETPAPSEDTTRYVAPDNSFSIKTPEGWQTSDLGLKYLALIGPMVEGINQNLVFVTETAAVPIATYAPAMRDGIQATLPDVTSISEEYLTSASGIDYFRWETENVQQGVTMRQIYYVIANGDFKLTMIYTRQPGEAPEQDALIDGLLDTIQFGA